MSVPSDEQVAGIDQGDADGYEYEPGDVNQREPVGVTDTDDPDEYEPGDVNTVGSSGFTPGAADDALAENGTPVEVLTYVARALAEEPDAVVVNTERRRGSVVLRLRVAPGDMGRVIGRRGRTAQAIRALVGAAGAREGVQTLVDIVDD